MSTQNESSVEDSPKVVYLRNFPFPGSKWFDPKTMEAALDYVPKDKDIILHSYPKTGTTWLQYIIWQIIYKGASYPSLQDMTYKCVPFMEMAGLESVENLRPPRTYKNHFPYHLVKINKNAKYIYIYRNPADTVVSYYHFLMSRDQRSYKFDIFFKRFLEGTLAYGNYFNHVLSFYTHEDEPHVLLVSYEDLKKDGRTQIFKIAKFLGEEYHKPLIEDGGLLDKILTVTSFDYMKKNVPSTLKTGDGNCAQERHLPMFRKGVVGDGKNMLSEEQLKLLKEQMLEKMRGTDILEQWLSY